MLAVQKNWNQPTHPVDRKLNSQRLAKQHVVAPPVKSAATLLKGDRSMPCTSDLIASRR
jgi:hypothetical protein